MSNLTRSLSLILVLAAIPRCEMGDSNPLESPEIPTANIHGVVTNSGSPISGAEVSLTAPGIARSATTGPDGSFAFANLPPAVYTLTVGQAGLSCEPTTFEVEAGETATASIACVEQLGTITGTVTAGLPIADAQVLVTTLGPPREVITDAVGVFTLTVPAGTYGVTSIPMGFICESVIVVVEADQTVIANIDCFEDE